MIAVEGRRSLQGRPKPLHYADNAQRFARFASKIIHVVLDDEPQDRALFRSAALYSLLQQLHADVL